MRLSKRREEAPRSVKARNATTPRAEGRGAVDVELLSRLPGTSVTELCSFAESLGSREGTAPVCLVAGDDPAASRGAAFASAMSRRLVVQRPEESSFRGALARARNASGTLRPSSVTLIATPERLAQLGIERIAASVEAFAGSCPFGILTAGDDGALGRLLERIALGGPPVREIGHLYWTSEDEIPVRLHDRDVSARVLDVREVKARVADPAAFVFADGHGVEHCAMAGHLCSRATPGSAEDRACVAGLDCVWGESPRVPVGDWRADVVFLASCLPANVHSGVDSPRNLVTRWLDGHARAVLAPLRANLRVPWIGYLAWDRLRAGLELGRWAAELDRAARDATRRSQPSLVLFGDPEMRLFERSDDDATEDTPQLEGASWRIRLPGNARVVRSVRVCDAEVLRAADEGHLRVRPGSDCGDEAAAMWFRTGDDEIRVLLAAKPGRGTRRIELTTETPFPESRIAAVRECVANLRVEGLLVDEAGALDETYADRLQAMLDEVAVDLVAVRGRGIPSLDTLASMQEVEREVWATCERAGSALLDSMRPDAYRGGLFLTSRYARYPGTTLVETPADPHADAAACPDCGEATLRTTTYQVGWSGLVRHVDDCERCGIVRDVPRGEASDDVGFDVPLRLIRGRPAELEVCGRNAKPHVELVQAIVTADGLGGTKERFPSDPVLAKAWVEPGESFRFAWRMTPDPRLLAHPYRIKAVLARNGLPTLLQRTRPVLPADLASRVDMDREPDAS